MNKGFVFALIGVVVSLAINVAIFYHLFSPPTFGFDILTSLSGFGYTGVSILPLIIWVLISRHLLGYNGQLLNWLLLPSFIMMLFYIIVPFIPN